MEPVERHGERAALGGGGVPGHGAEDQAGGRQGEGLKSQREPVTLAILVRQEKQRRQEGQQSHPREPDRAVAGVDQDGQDATALQALPGARARGHPDLAPEVEHPGPEGHCESGPAEREKADVQLPKPLAPDVARGASRRARHQDERREGADERDRSGRVEPANGDRGGLHERDQEDEEAGARPCARGDADHRAVGAVRRAPAPIRRAPWIPGGPPCDRARRTPTPPG